MKNLLQKIIKTRQSPELSQEQPQNQSPNLLSYRFVNTNFIATNQDKIVKFFRYPIILIQIVFILVVIANFIINKQLNAAEKRVSTLEYQLLEKSSVYEKSRQVHKQIEKYKEVDSQRLVFGRRSEELISLLPATVSVKSLEMKPGDSTTFAMLIKLETSDALSVAFIINRFLEVSDVDHVVLSSASLAAYNNSYEVVLEVGTR